MPGRFTIQGYARDLSDSQNAEIARGPDVDCRRRARCDLGGGLVVAASRLHTVQRLGCRPLDSGRRGDPWTDRNDRRRSRCAGPQPVTGGTQGVHRTDRTHPGGRCIDERRRRRRTRTTDRLVRSTRRDHGAGAGQHRAQRTRRRGTAADIAGPASRVGGVPRRLARRGWHSARWGSGCSSRSPASSFAQSAARELSRSACCSRPRQDHWSSSATSCRCSSFRRSPTTSGWACSHASQTITEI